MNTNDEQQEWEKKLSAAGFAVDGIDHTDAAVMKEVYKTLGLKCSFIHLTIRNPTLGQLEPCIGTAAIWIVSVSIVTGADWHVPLVMGIPCSE